MPEARRWRLDNGLQVVAVQVEQAPILMLELIWRAGRPYEAQPLVAQATNALLLEGSRHRSGSDIEAAFEYFGTSLEVPEDYDTANISLATIARHADRLLPLLAEIVGEPAFSEVDLRRFKKRSKQQLREDHEDPDWLAYRHLSEAVFGREHPYGYAGSKAEYDRLTTAVIRDHYGKYFGAANATLRIVGKLDARIEQLLNETLGRLPAGSAVHPLSYVPPSEAPGSLRVNRHGAQHTLIRRGRRGIDVTDPDFPAIAVLETVLGGYYGSRLMRNIREEKGYTYGIDTELDTYRYDGTFGIAADVANENLERVRMEIDTEMAKLREDRIPAQELDMVRAYLLGGLVQDLDGPIAVSGRYRAAIIKGYDAQEHLRRLSETIHSITAEELRDLAQRFLRPELDTEVILGGAA